MKRVFVYKNDYRIACSDLGDPNGFPVLIQHGMIASIDDEPLFDHLIAAGMRVISFARPGYGESTPFEMKCIGEWGEIAASLLGDLGIDKFDVFGISSGAPYAYSIANTLPKQVRNVYVLSGIPALYDEQLAAAWPYPVVKNAVMPEMQRLAFDLFFAGCSDEERMKNDVRDSMRNNCFGPAQDLRIRGMNWGFRLQDLGCKVTMQHSRSDQLVCAQLTASMLPNCELIIHEGADHFSQSLLDEFIDKIMLRNRAE